MSTNRRRGHDFERRVAKLFRRWFPEAKRGYQYRGSDKDCDIVGTPYFIECKYAKKRFNYSLLTIWNKMWERIVRQHIPGPLVLVIRRLAYRPIMVSMSRMGANLLDISTENDGSGIVSCTWDIFSKAMDEKHGVRDERPSD